MLLKACTRLYMATTRTFDCFDSFLHIRIWLMGRVYMGFWWSLIKLLKLAFVSFSWSCSLDNWFEHQRCFRSMWRSPVRFAWRTLFRQLWLLLWSLVCIHCPDPICRWIFLWLFHFSRRSQTCFQRKLVVFLLNLNRLLKNVGIYLAAWRRKVNM